MSNIDKDIIRVFTLSDGIAWFVGLTFGLFSICLICRHNMYGIILLLVPFIVIPTFSNLYEKYLKFRFSTALKIFLVIIISIVYLFCFNVIAQT